MPKGRRPQVDHVRENFLYQVTVARNLEAAVRPLAAVHPGAVGRLHPKHVYRTVELAFMGVCAAWEDFLETSMIRYLANAKTASGFAPKLRVGPCQDISHAYQVLSGRTDYNPEVHYMSWTKPSAVVKFAEVWFTDGKPYKIPLLREADRLKQAVRFRNRVAHASEKCIADFKEAANAIRQLPLDQPLGQGFRVGELLSANAGAFFGAGIPALNISNFEAFVQTFENTASEIVPV